MKINQPSVNGGGGVSAGAGLSKSGSSLLLDFAHANDFTARQTVTLNATAATDAAEFYADRGSTGTGNPNFFETFRTGQNNTGYGIAMGYGSRNAGGTLAYNVIRGIGNDRMVLLNGGVATTNAFLLADTSGNVQLGGLIDFVNNFSGIQLNGQVSFFSANSLPFTVNSPTVYGGNAVSGGSNGDMIFQMRSLTGKKYGWINTTGTATLVEIGDASLVVKVQTLLSTGTATAGTAPLKFQSGTNLTAAEIGAVEYDGTSLFMTNGGAQRQELMQAQQSRIKTQFDKTDTTLANTGLIATLVAGETYRFRAVLHVTLDVTGGQKYAIGGTATATNILYEIIAVDNSTNANVITSRQTALAGSAGAAGATSSFVRIEGLITCNAAGTLTVQFAENASSGTSSVLVGSNFEVIQMA